MSQLTRQDVRQAFHFLCGASVFTDAGALVRYAVTQLPGLVPSELTTLSDCDLVADTRRVTAFPGNAISPGERACFDHYIHQHPLVQFHSQWPNQKARRISDCLPTSWFRRTELYNEYYRRIGIGHVVALPLITGQSRVVSFVLNRERRNFSERDREMLDLLRPGLMNLYFRAQEVDEIRKELLALMDRFNSQGSDIRDIAAESVLTAREREVLLWVSRGKSNTQIGVILAASSRTVQKHLEHIFEKLGVENRTAAVERWRRLAQKA